MCLQNSASHLLNTKEEHLELMTPNNILPWLLPGSLQETSAHQRTISPHTDELRGNRAVEEASVTQPEMWAPAWGSPGLSQDSLRPMGPGGIHQVGQWDRVTSQTKRGHSLDSMRNLVGFWKRASGDSTRLIMGCLGEKAVAGKGIDLGDLGRNKNWKIE